MVSVLDSKLTAEGLKNFALTVSQPSAAQKTVQVAIAPATFTLAAGASHQFAANVSNTSNHQVNWWTSSGNITSAGYFTAPIVHGATKVQIVASSKADTSKRGFAYAGVTAGVTSTTPLGVKNSALAE